MKMTDTEISFKVLYAGMSYNISTHAREYGSLMNLIKDRIYPQDFGECGGMGRCGTCLVNIENCKSPSSLVGKEANTLNKMGINDPHARLSCQIDVDENLDNIIITIPSDY
jgi:2Fe-2S ferredoxin